VARKCKTLAAKSVKNLIALLREMWEQAKADGYTQVDPFAALRLPEPELINERCLTLDEMKAVINAAPEPDKTYYWIHAETGIRCGEACGLPVSNLLLDLGAIKITQKVWHGKLETVKSIKGQPTLRNLPAVGGASSHATLNDQLDSMHFATATKRSWTRKRCRWPRGRIGSAIPIRARQCGIHT